MINRAVDDYLAGLEIHRLTAAEISGDTHADSRGESMRASTTPPSTSVRRSRRGASTWSSASRCSNTSWIRRRRPEPPRALRARRTRDRLDAFPDQGPRAADVRDERLLAIHAEGMRTLLERGGLEVEEVGSWGNRECVVGNFDRWSAHRRWHSLETSRTCRSRSGLLPAALPEPDERRRPLGTVRA